MNPEIERKFFVRELPDLSGIEPLHYERYILEKGNGTERRISKINDSYWLEEKTDVSELARTRNKEEISKAQFETLQKTALGSIIRDRYNLGTNPDIALQIYRGSFEGLMRAEVEFASETEANAFVPLSWMGKEMTGLPIARDSNLIDLSDEEFKQYLELK